MLLKAEGFRVVLYYLFVLIVLFSALVTAALAAFIGRRSALHVRRRRRLQRCLGRATALNVRLRRGASLRRRLERVDPLRRRRWKRIHGTAVLISPTPTELLVRRRTLIRLTLRWLVRLTLRRRVRLT